MLEVFKKIETTLPTMHGWCTPLKGQMLAASVVAVRPVNTVIIGVWGGRDLLAMALAHKEIGQGIVHGIDPWNRTASVEGQEKDHADWWGKIDHEMVYQDCIRRIHENGVQDFVRIYRERSDTVTPPNPIRLLLIDGNHGPQAIKDVERYAPAVPVGGLVMLDDLQWSGGNVLRAAARLKSLGFQSLYKVDTSEMFQRTG